MSKLVVIAIGGNSLIRDNKNVTVEDQIEAIIETTDYISDLAKMGYNIVITHGNGPQVGFILKRSEIANKVEGMHNVPLDVCGADTQGAIGYQLQQALYNHFRKKGIDRQVATVVTQVIVDKNDPSFKNPSKPIGSFMTKEEADVKKKNENWDVVEDAGRGYRRVVASPLPVKIVEQDIIIDLIKKGVIVIAVGGGGIPVIELDNHSLKGTAAVIDKDYATSLLASEINADVLFISTAVEKAYINFGKPNQAPIDKASLTELKKYIEEDHFKPGSMLPKVKAIIKFLENGGKEAIITDPANIVNAIQGKTGTHVHK